MTDLATELEVSKPSASNMVKRLERKELISRIPCHEDGRAQRLILTGVASKHLESEAMIYGILARQISQNLTEEEAAFLDVLLTKALK